MVRDRRGIVTPVLVHQQDLSTIPQDLELALMFAFSEYERKRHEQFRNATYEFFSKILWPLILIQTGAERYIGIDGLFFFDLQFKRTKFLSSDNPIFLILGQEKSYQNPRVHLDQLSQCINELKTPINEEFRLKGIIGPELLHGLVPLIKLASERPLSAVKLNPIISIDSVIAITNSFNQVLRSIEETISKWHSLQQIIERKYEKWHVFYAKSLSDIEQSQIKSKYNELKKTLLDRLWDCRNEIDYLLHWAISGKILDLVVPITELWISMYLAEVKLPNGKRKSILIPPSVFSEKIQPYERLPVNAFHSSFSSILKAKVEPLLDSNLPVAQKIKQSCMTQNLLLKEEAHKLIMNGFHRLREKPLIESTFIDQLEQQWQKSSLILRK
ncbi:MAG: hypothetical protein ACTSRC_01570 [Candidatus Helarchaeota archaeon]